MDANQAKFIAAGASATTYGSAPLQGRAFDGLMQTGVMGGLEAGVGIGLLAILIGKVAQEFGARQGPGIL